MQNWFELGYFSLNLLVKRSGDQEFQTLNSVLQQQNQNENQNQNTSQQAQQLQPQSQLQSQFQSQFQSQLQPQQSNLQSLDPSISLQMQQEQSMQMGRLFNNVELDQFQHVALEPFTTPVLFSTPGIYNVNDLEQQIICNSNNILTNQNIWLMQQQLSMMPQSDFNPGLLYLQNYYQSQNFYQNN
eukprot:TRINITY_DN14_c0_g3_i2.p1 TRINITY_DN14_c0_g3~~TRINITY_DN14_c0_g3_i2.p1  ORF type:complete len:185 (-),score=68.30 TRINITY_DN14_c0_g3_i2:116-670(-)